MKIKRKRANKANKEYIVLSIKIYSDEISFRLTNEEDDKESPFIEDKNMCEIISNKIPSNWVINIDNIGNLEMLPESWLNKNWKYSFWESYYDECDSKAIECYYKERQIIYACEGISVPLY